MSGYRVDHMSHQIETTWDNPDGTPYTQQQEAKVMPKPPKGSVFIELWKTMTPEEIKKISTRFDRKHIKSPDGCWLWTGSTKSGGGYGHMKLKLTSIGAHRVGWVLAGRELVVGFELDHLCRVRHCVNPDHLDLVPPVVNFRRGMALAAQNLRKTHCKRGHEFTPENTRLSAGGARRCCKACERTKPRRAQERLAAERKAAREARRNQKDAA